MRATPGVHVTLYNIKGYSTETAGSRRGCNRHAPPLNLIPPLFFPLVFIWTLQNIQGSDCIMREHLKPYTGWPKKNGTVNFLWLSSGQQLSFFTLPDRASFPHYNNTKIVKFGLKLFILWVISYGLSFSGFARFPEFRGTINDIFRPSINWPKYCLQWSVYCPLTYILHCLTRNYNFQAGHWHWDFFVSSLNAGMCWRMCCWKLSLIVPRNSGNQANP